MFSFNLLPNEKVWKQTRKRTIVAVGCIVLVLLAGCSTTPIDETTNTTTSIGTPNRTGSISTTPEATTTTVAEQRTTAKREATTEGIYHNEEYELKVRNPTNRTKRLAVEIAFENGTTLLNKSVTVEGNSSTGFNFTYPYSGNYKITANTTDDSAVQIWSVEVRDPAAVVVVWLEEEGVDIDIYVS